MSFYVLWMYLMPILIVPLGQMNQLISSSSEKLHEAGLDEQGAAAAMSEHLGRLLDWVHTYIPHNCPLPVSGVIAPQTASQGVTSHAGPVFNLGSRGGSGDAPLPPPAAATGRDWKGGPLDMGPNSWNGGS